MDDPSSCHASDRSVLGRHRVSSISLVSLGALMFAPMKLISNPVEAKELTYHN